MKLTEKYITNNWCYRYGVSGAYPRMTPKGIVVHSTGCHQTSADIWQSIWNRGSTETAVHAVIGLSKGDVVTYQLMPWNMQSWGCGGRFNQSHIQFEIGEDGLTDRAYFDRVFGEAIELCVYLCKLYSLTPEDIVSHKEAHALGGATPHSDCNHWMKNFGLDMDWFRACVRERLWADEDSKDEDSKEPEHTAPVVGDVVTFAGTVHYRSANASTGSACKPGKARITRIAEGAKHPYSLIRTGEDGGTVYGWVDADTITELQGDVTQDKPWEPSVGDLVRFNGTVQYRTANEMGEWPAKPCEARLERIVSGKHPYLLKHTGSGGVYGWVDKGYIERA